MSSKSKIEWTEATWNPTLGCSKISPGCKGCYAIAQVHRMAGNPNQKIAAANAGLTVIQGGQANWTGEVRLIADRLDIPLRRKKPTVYFVNSLSDLFHHGLAPEEIAEVFKVMYRANWHTFQILTKHGAGEDELMVQIMQRIVATFGPVPSHIWLGVSVESKEYLPRIDVLRRTPASVRFLSLEPLLEDLGELDLRGIDWVIAGGESRLKDRPLHPDWVRSIHKQCVAAGVPFFFKQWGEWSPGYIERCYELKNCSYRPEWMDRPEAAPWWPDGTRGYGDHKSNGGLAVSWTRVGKKAAGRFLDGREWNEMPGAKVAGA